MRISDWSSDVCSSDLIDLETIAAAAPMTELLAVEPGAELVRAVRVRWQDDAPLGHYVTHVPAALGVKLTPATLGKTPMLTLIKEAGIRIGAADQTIKIGRASCRERVCQYV